MQIALQSSTKTYKAFETDDRSKHTHTNIHSAQEGHRFMKEKNLNDVPPSTEHDHVIEVPYIDSALLLKEMTQISDSFIHDLLVSAGKDDLFNRYLPRMTLPIILFLFFESKCFYL